MQRRRGRSDEQGEEERPTQRPRVEQQAMAVLSGSDSVGVDVAEVFSPVRLNALAANWGGLKPGHSFDITEIDPITQKTWDLSLPHVQGRVKGLIRRVRPKLVVLSPPCTMFSALQFMNPAWGSESWRKQLAVAEDLLRFSCEVATLQHKLGVFRL